jgi:hypothetical protein
MKIRVRVPGSASAVLERGSIILLLPILVWSLFRGVTVYATVTADGAFRESLIPHEVKIPKGSADIGAQLLAIVGSRVRPVRTSRCSPMLDEELAWVVSGVTRKYAIESALLRAIIDTESSRRPCVTSDRGAIGLMQLMPGTAKQLGVDDPYDPQSNVEAGARYLKLMLKRYDNDLPRALSAYNAGPGVTDRHAGVPPIPETQKYVQTVLRRVEGFNLQ